MFGPENSRLQVNAVARVAVKPIARAQNSTSLRQDSQIPSFPLATVGPFVAASPLRRSKLLAKASVFIRLRSLLSVQKLQHPYFHPLSHSLKKEQNATPVFPITPALFVRSWSNAHYSTLLFSSACALFRKTTGGRGTAAKENFSARSHLRPAVRHEFDVGPIMDCSRLS
jgi:hypothetical protein